MANISRLCVFCGSNVGDDPAFAESARTMGGLLARERITLVYGGGGTGLMGVVADSVLAAGGKAIGVIPGPLATKELAHAGLTEMHVVESMHQRKAMMADLADAFVALPGGMGTFEEILEIITWTQLGIHAKPCGLLNVAGYYNSLVSLFDHAVERKFVDRRFRELILVEREPRAMLERMRKYDAPPLSRWADVSQR